VGKGEMAGDDGLEIFLGTYAGEGVCEGRRTAADIVIICCI